MPYQQLGQRYAHPHNGSDHGQEEQSSILCCYNEMHLKNRHIPAVHLNTALALLQCCILVTTLKQFLFMLLHGNNKTQRSQTTA